MSSHRTAGKIFTLLSLIVSSAEAQESERIDSWEARPDAIELHVGFGTPVGYLGVAYDRVIWSRWSVNIGAGVGSGREGGSLHLAAGTRFRLFQSGRSAVYFGFDYSTGGYRRVEIPTFVPNSGSSSYGYRRSEPVVYSRRVHWLQGSVGYELRTATGVVFRPYLGIAFMLNPESRRCVDELSGKPCGGHEGFEGDSIPVFGLAIGGAQ